MLIKLLITVFSVIVIAYFIGGVDVAGPWAALILGLVNIFIKPLLILITLPINFITLGLFSFVINALMIMLVASVVEGFSVDGFVSALIFSIILSVLTSFLNKIIADKGI